MFEKPYRTGNARLLPSPEASRRRAAGETKWVALRVAGSLGLALVFALSYLLPRTGPGLDTCAFRHVFGMPCPGCGLTRAFRAISHGELAQAVGFHPLAPLIYLAFAIYMVKWGIEALIRRRLLRKTEDRYAYPVLWGFLILMLAVWVIRLITGAAR